MSGTYLPAIRQSDGNVCITRTCSSISQAVGCNSSDCYCTTCCHLSLLPPCRITVYTYICTTAYSTTQQLLRLQHSRVVEDEVLGACCCSCCRSHAGNTRVARMTSGPNSYRSEATTSSRCESPGAAAQRHERQQDWGFPVACLRSLRAGYATEEAGYHS
jgi:hypothetical protein